MKTINKILLGILAVIMIVIAVGIFTLKSFNKSSLVKGNHIYSKQIRQIPSFGKLIVNGGITVFYTADTTSMIRIEADSNLIQLVKTEVKDNELTVFLFGGISGDSKITVYVYNDSLNELALRSGAVFKTVKPIKVESLSVRASSGSNPEITGHFGNLDLVINSGSRADLKGTTLSFYCIANSGSELNAGNFNITNCQLEASAGSALKVNVNGNLGVKANSGSTIIYSGNPVIKEMDLSGGANMKKE